MSIPWHRAHSYQYIMYFYVFIEYMTEATSGGKIYSSVQVRSYQLITAGKVCDDRLGLWR